MRQHQTIADFVPAAEWAALVAEIDHRPAAVADDTAAQAEALLTRLAAAGRVAGLLAALAERAPDVPWGTLPWPPAALAALHDHLDHRLSHDALRDLCLRLGIDPDDLPGESRRGRLRELILHMHRAGRMGDLAAATEPRMAAPPSAPRPARRSLPAWGMALLLPAALGLLLAAGARQGASWSPGPPLPDGVVGVAVAEFAETAGCRSGARGREAATLLYATLERELAAAGLGRRVALTRAGRVCDDAAALAAGRAAGASVVVWGWLPAASEGLFAQFTPAGPAPAVSTDLARAYEALFTGPEELLSLRLSGRAVVLSRFLLGLIHAAAGDAAAAESFYSAAVADVTAEMATAPDSAELRRTLAVLLTERGKARAALGRAAAARADYDAAERLNPHYLRLLVARAAEAYGRRDWDAAEAYLDRAALQNEPLPAIAYGYGLLAYYRGQYEASLAHFDRAIALSAGDGSDAAVYHLARGYSYVELGDCDAAADDFDAAGLAPAAEVATAAAVAGRAGCGPSTGVGGRPPATPPAATPRPEATRLSPLAMAAAAPTRPAGQVATAAASAPATPGPLLVEIGPRGANVRRGPGAEYPVMATRRAGATLEVLAASASGEWFQVRVPGQGRGWVSAAYAVALGDVGQLGVGIYQSGVVGSAVDEPGGSPAPESDSRDVPYPRPATPSVVPATATAGSPTAPAPPPGALPTRSPLPTATPPAPVRPTATLLPAPTGRAGGP